MDAVFQCTTTMRRFLCRRNTAQQTLPIGQYINDLHTVDKTLISLINKTEMEILRVTKLGSSKHIARRRLMLKRHKQLIEERRDNILARILQLESLHVYNIQLDALRGVSKAFKGSKYTIGDVDALLDRLQDFRDDMDEVTERLSSDMQFSATGDFSDEELLAELQQLQESDTPTVQKMLTTVPDLPADLGNLPQVHLETGHSEHSGEEDDAPHLLPALS